MNKPTILIFGYDTLELEELVSLAKQQMHSLIASTEDDAINQFLQTRFDAVLFAKSISTESKAKLSKLFSFQQHGIVFIDDQGDLKTTEELLKAIEIKQKENRPAFSFQDDVLKNAGLNIKIQ